MDQNSIKVRLREVFVNALRLHLNPTEVEDEGLIAKLGIDSISSLEILIWVEQEFGIVFEDVDLSPVLVDSLETLSSYILKSKAMA
jgi:acyl carrier protein